MLTDRNDTPRFVMAKASRELLLALADASSDAKDDVLDKSPPAALAVG
jgi:hypothetical protein